MSPTYVYVTYGYYANELGLLSRKRVRDLGLGFN